MSKTSPSIFWLLIALILPFTFSCSKDPDSDVANVDLDLDFVRVDSMMWEFAKACQEDSNLDIYQAFDTYLGSERDFFYEYLNMSEVARVRKLSPGLADSVMKAQLATLLREKAMYELLDTVNDVFPYDVDLEREFLPPLKRLVKLFPDIQLPAFRSFVNGYVPGGDMRTVDQVVPLPNYFGFGLHYFMGPKFLYYPVNIAAYQRRYFDAEYMEVEMCREIVEGMVRPLDPRTSPTLIAGMVREGIKQYFLERLLPNTPDSVRLAYTSKQMMWADTYEDRIYKELIDQFFSTDFKLHREYLAEKPFTASLSRESAPRIGEYCGWKMVSAYMQRHPEVSLEELTGMNDYEKILRESRYKPDPS